MKSPEDFSGRQNVYQSCQNSQNDWRKCLQWLFKQLFPFQISNEKFSHQSIGRSVWLKHQQKSSNQSISHGLVDCGISQVEEYMVVVSIVCNWSISREVIPFDRSVSRGMFGSEFLDQKNSRLLLKFIMSGWSGQENPRNTVTFWARYQARKTWISAQPTNRARKTRGQIHHGWDTEPGKSVYLDTRPGKPVYP